MYNFPIQPRPDQPSIRLCKRALWKCFSLLYNTTLIPQLKCWTIPTASTQQWYYLPKHQCLFNNNWHRASRAGTLGQYPKFRAHSSNTMTIPNNCVRVTVAKETDHIIRLTGWFREEEHLQQDCQIQSIHNDFLDDLDVIDEATLLSIMTVVLREGSLRVVSDGSYFDKHKLGTAAWIIEAPDRTLTSGRVIIPGAEDVQGSYRSELGGIYGAITHLHLICKICEIVTGKITLGCDGLGAVHIIEKEIQTTKSNMEQFDVIRIQPLTCERAPGRLLQFP